MLTLRPSLTWRVVDREALIVDLDTGDYFSLNPIATDIWERLQAGQLPDAPTTRPRLFSQ